MDRVSHLRGDAGGSRDSTLDTTSPPSESFMTANESSSKYYSLSEVDSTFDISSIKDVSLPSTTTDSEGTITNTEELVSNLSPIANKSDMLDSYKIGGQIEAANILSGGVDIFDDNENSYDGDELVIDDNVEVDDKLNSELKQPESVQYKTDENIIESTLINEEADIASKDTEVVLQIDGKNVDAIDIGNGLYLYRKEGQEELAAVQIIDDGQHQPSFKFLKVRENAEGNLEVYEEIEIEVPKEVPVKEVKTAVKKISSHVPIKDINKVISESACNKVAERKIKTPRKEPITTTSEVDYEANKDTSPDGKSEVNLNGKMMKFSELRKSPVIGSFKPMTYHSTPNKEGIPLTKTMVDQQLHPNRHSDNIKKTIEVHTDSCKQRPIESPPKHKDADDNKLYDITSSENQIFIDKSVIVVEEKDQQNKDEKVEVKSDDEVSTDKQEDPMEQDNVIDSTGKDHNKENAVLIKDTQMINNAIVEDEVIIDSKVDDKANIKEMEIESEITVTIGENTSTDKSEVKVPLSNVDYGSDAKVDAIIKINEDELKIAEPMKPNVTHEIVQSNKKKELKAEDNAQGDSQYENKVVKNICGVTSYHVKNNEIIVIDDSQIDNTKDKDIIVTTDDIKSKMKERVTVCYKEDTKTPNIESSCKKGLELQPNIKIMNNDKPSMDNFEIGNKIDKKVAENKLTGLSSSVIPNTKKEELNKCPPPPLLQFPKNSQSKIPKPESNKLPSKPSGSECIAMVGTPISIEAKQKNTTSITKSSEINLTTKVKEITKDSLEKKSAQLHKTSDTQKIMIEQQKSPNKLHVAVEKVADMIPTIKTDITSSTSSIVQQKETKLLEVSSKEEPKKAIQVTESQPPVQVDSKRNVTLENSNEGKITSCSIDNKTHIPQGKSQSKLELKPPFVTNKNEQQEVKTPPKETNADNIKSVKDVEVIKVPTIEPIPSCSTSRYNSSDVMVKQDEVPSTSTDTAAVEETRPTNNNKAAVPFGKWTDTNRKEFLDKIRIRVAPPAATPSTSNQLKNSNDLNRRDVLQKIDSQRQSSNALSKTQEANKLSTKNETAFLSKTNVNIVNKEPNTQEVPDPVITEVVEITSNAVTDKATIKKDVTITQNELPQVATVANVTKKESAERTEVNYQDLIDKTIEGMIHRTVQAPKAAQDEPNQSSVKDPNVKYPPNYEPTDQATLDAIEMKMNELHGIPFIERPPHELPQVPIPEHKSFSKADKEKQSNPNKTTKIPNLLPFANKTQQKIIKESVIEVESEDEIIEHEPITGDIDSNKKNLAAKPLSIEKIPSNTNLDKSNVDATKKDSIITEKDFDKFARRNSITYENCLTVSFDGKEPHNVVQTVVEKDLCPKSYSRELCPKSYSRNEMARVDPRAKIPFKHQNVRPQTQPGKVNAPNKFGPNTEESSNRNQSKFQKAYQSALTAKRQMECPITIIEDKPVKVVFMDNMEFVPSQLNVQGKELSPAKKMFTEPDNLTVSTCDSLDLDALDAIDDAKSQDEIKTKKQEEVKTKHQRKQVLTPVEEPELELIEPKDLGLEVSPKKKRRTDEDKTDKSGKYPMRKKYYLLGSNTATEEKIINTVDTMKNPLKETFNRNDNGVAHKHTVSAIDNLVKAAELLEHQSENMIISDSPNPDSQQSTPVKRGRGRPRKYPLPEGVMDKNKVVSQPSPQKKPRLIDAKASKRDTTTDDDDSGDEIIKENWTMGKINENIVCPICNKLFRTENVVFKHVKHCTGPSPSRSGSDKRSPRRIRSSQESDSKSFESKSDDMDIDDDLPLVVTQKISQKIRNSKDSAAKSDDKDDVIVIEDTPVKWKPKTEEKKIDERKHHESRKPRAKALLKTNDLVCEFCGKTFRQLSYLVSHKLQHKKDDAKKSEKEAPAANVSVFSCEVCKKDFRKLHHLVQHRIIHNSSSVIARSQRKSSSDQSDIKIEKEPCASKQSEDLSAGFRCEPCDKSFRKLHHLVEHRETHDGINRQKTTTVAQTNVEKPVSLHQCEVCKKTFRKLHHLIEHKEQHVETSSEKCDDVSDDKSVKSSLSTRDIIHECSLCYMVFPNEHSLNKHTIICQRKKRQSKQAKLPEESEAVESIDDSSVCSKKDDKLGEVDTSKPAVEELKVDEGKHGVIEKVEFIKEMPQVSNEKSTEIVKEEEIVTEDVLHKIETNPSETVVVPAKRDFPQTESTKLETKADVPEKIKKVEVKEAAKTLATPKKKTPLKEKSSGSASKRRKSIAHVSVADEVKPAAESSDDDEVRYMLNPNFKVEDTAEEKIFMKVRGSKRSSLQIERPNSKDLVKRRTSLQHPPKIPRLKPKAIEPNNVTVKNIAKASKLQTVPSTDSDDSETVKYSFPKTIPEKPTKHIQDRTSKDIERKTQKKLLSDKRKTLSGIAKRKSLGKVATPRRNPSTASPMKQPPIKAIKRRTCEAEHRCDCGQLFSSAALLWRHTSLAHTPPRIRRRRSPLPDDKPVPKPTLRKSSVADKPKQTPTTRKSIPRSESSTSTNTKTNKSDAKSTRKSLENETKTPADARKPKIEKTEAKSSAKPRRTGAHRGVPVPEKMRKLMQKNNK